MGEVSYGIYAAGISGSFCIRGEIGTGRFHCRMYRKMARAYSEGRVAIGAPFGSFFRRCTKGSMRWQSKCGSETISCSEIRTRNLANPRYEREKKGDLDSC